MTTIFKGAGPHPRDGAPGSLQRSSTVTRKVQLSQSALSDILRHAREEAPNECCGLLVGDGHRIERAVRARNLEASPRRFLIDPADHFVAIRAARATGHAVVGAYHSHVSAAAVPSETDMAESTGDAHFVHVIVSLARLRPDSALRASSRSRRSATREGGQGYGGQAGGASDDAVRAYYFKENGFEPVELEVA